MDFGLPDFHHPGLAQIGKVFAYQFIISKCISKLNPIELMEIKAKSFQTPHRLINIGFIHFSFWNESITNRTQYMLHQKSRKKLVSKPAIRTNFPQSYQMQSPPSWNPSVIYYHWLSRTDMSARSPLDGRRGVSLPETMPATSNEPGERNWITCDRDVQTKTYLHTKFDILCKRSHSATLYSLAGWVGSSSWSSNRLTAVARASLVLGGEWLAVWVDLINNGRNNECLVLVKC